MRLLHTSDWHLGRSFHRAGLLEAQAAFLDHLADVVRTEKVDAVIVAGDVYDRALPGVDVVALLDDALARLADTGATVILTSGNHDSARRLGFGSRLLARAGLHVRTDPRRCGEPVLLADADGPVAIYPLPYLEPALVAEALGSPASHAGVLTAAMAAVRADLSARPAGTRSVVSAHAFVIGGEACDSERDIGVGGVAAVGAAVFDGVDYVALGHLHRRQRIDDAVQYCGSPLAYSFSEHAQAKGSLLVELEARGSVSVQPVDAPVPRPLAVLRGRLEDLLADPSLEPHETAWCQVTLTDAQRPPEAMARVRLRFAHTLELRFEPEGGPCGAAQTYTARVSGRDDVDVCCGFVEHVARRAPTPDEVGLLRQAVEWARLADVEQVGAAAARAARRASAASAGPTRVVEVVEEIELEAVG